MGDVASFILSNAVREAAHPLTGASDDYDPLMRLIDDARFVLLGEASHGTCDDACAPPLSDLAGDG